MYLETIHKQLRVSSCTSRSCRCDCVSVCTVDILCGNSHVLSLGLMVLFVDRAAEKTADGRLVEDRLGGLCLSPRRFMSLSLVDTHSSSGTCALHRGVRSCSIIVCQLSIQLSKAEPRVKENSNSWRNWHKQEKKKKIVFLFVFFAFSHKRR